MPNFAVNLSMLFTELPLIERFDAAAQAGFKQVEIQFPYELTPDEIKAALQRNQQTLVLINLPAGDWAGGERGIACHPDRVEEFNHGVNLALEYATSLGVKKINCLSGIKPDDVSSQSAEETFARNLKHAANTLGAHDIQLMAEAINTQDIAGFFLNTSRQLVDLKESFCINNLYLQYDVYHMQIMEGNLITTLQKNLRNVGHIQIADVPGRHEPGTGEINFPNLFKAIDAMGYSGTISLEYVPAADTLSGLAQVKPIIGGQ
ncbi:MAG: hydroxypyruvate isomerase family protein [Oceanospirillaceae bacterium]|nr:hydroxypyruvate isomerase family protein [Oceanospirillaceae bacterium]